jgi:hypothetical protein
VSYRESSGQTFRLEVGAVLPPGRKMEAEALRASWLGAFIGVLLGLLLVFVAFGSVRLSVIPCFAGAAGYFVGGVVARRLYLRRHGAKRARDTTLERVGGKIVVTTHTRTFEMDVAQVRKANWIEPVVAGENARFGVALLLGEYGAVACQTELVDVEWRTLEYVAHPTCTVDEALFRQLAAALLPEPLEPSRMTEEAENAPEEPAYLRR